MGRHVLGALGFLEGLMGPSGLTGAAFADDGASVRHVTVYPEPGMFGGWPASHGIWSCPHPVKLPGQEP